jgi:glutamyl-tRNA synthetase
MIELFDLAEVQKSPARFDIEKLNWLNQHYMKAADNGVLVDGMARELERLGVAITDRTLLAPVAEAFRERAKTFVELAEQARVYVADLPGYDAKSAAKHLGSDSIDLLTQVRARLAQLPQWTVESTQLVVEEVAKLSGVGMGKVAQPIRVAVTGGTASPGIGVTLHILGREKTLERLERAIAFARGSRSGA